MTTWLSRAQCAAELDELPVGVRQVDVTRLITPVEPDGGVAPSLRIRALRATAGPVAEDRVRQLDDEAAPLVGEVDLERSSASSSGLGVRRGQPSASGRLAGEDAVLAVGELEDGRAVGLLDDQARDAVVAAPGVGYSSATGIAERGSRTRRTAAARGGRYDRPVASGSAEMEDGRARRCRGSRWT